MATSVFINLEALIYNAYKLGLNADRDDEPLSMAEVRALVLKNVPVGAPAPKAAVSKGKSVSEKEEKPKQTRTRTIPADELRCCAKKANGERCAMKKIGDDDFCKFHENKQPNGIWEEQEDSDVEITEAPKKASAPVAPKARSKSVEPKKALEKPKEVSAKAPAKAPAKSKANAKVLDIDDLEENENFVKPLKNKDQEFIEIDDEEGETKTYLINKKGEVFNPENDKKLGVYDRKKQEWISGGPLTLEDYSDYEDQINHLDSFLGDIKKGSKKDDPEELEDLEDDE